MRIAMPMPWLLAPGGDAARRPPVLDPEPTSRRHLPRPRRRLASIRRASAPNGRGCRTVAAALDACRGRHAACLRPSRTSPTRPWVDAPRRMSEVRSHRPRASNIPRVKKEPKWRRESPKRPVKASTRATTPDFATRLRGGSPPLRAGATAHLASGRKPGVKMSLAGTTPSGPGVGVKSRGEPASTP